MTSVSPTELSERRERAAALATRVGAQVLELKVAATSELSRDMLRIRLVSRDLVGFSYLPGQDLMIAVGQGGTATVRRRYTICHLDSVEGNVDLDVVVHGEGPGAKWARTASVGDVVEAIGPRGKVTLDHDARWHLFIGDDAFVPAAFAMMAAAGDTPTRALLEVKDATGERFELRAPTSIEWIHRRDVEPGVSRALIGALSSTDLPTGRGFVYVGGEHLIVREIRDLLLSRGLSEDQMSAKAYWRLGSANADHGEPPRD